MKVSIIGSNGLLSNSLGRFCNQQNFELDIYGRTIPKNHQYTNFFKLDLALEQIDFTHLIQSDLVVYAAGAGIQSNLKEELTYIYELNVVAPIKIFNTLKRLNFKGTFVSFGSYFEIGETAEYKVFDEIGVLSSQMNAPNDYTVSKRTLSRYLSSVQSEFKHYHFILPTIYGESESPNRLIPYTLKSIKNNEELRFTSGDQIRQYIYIEDVVSMIFSSIDKNLIGGVYNIAGVEELSVKELVMMLFQLMGVEVLPDIFGKAERKDVGMKVLRLNGEKLLKNINYIPTTKISDIYVKYRFE